MTTATRSRTGLTVHVDREDFRYVKVGRNEFRITNCCDSSAQTVKSGETRCKKCGTAAPAAYALPVCHRRKPRPSAKPKTGNVPVARESATVQVASASEPSIFYSVSVLPNKSGQTDYSCTCKGFKHRGYCKHILSVRESLNTRPSRKISKSTTTTKENTMSKTAVKKSSTTVSNNNKESKMIDVTISAEGFDTMTVPMTKSDARDLGLVKTAKSTKSASKPVAEKVETPNKVKTIKFDFPTGVPVNVKVTGEKSMRKSIVLVQHPSRADVVLVKTGQRGRPSMLPVEKIVKVRALA